MPEPEPRSPRPLGFDDLPRPAGWIEAAREEGDGHRLSGWALMPARGPFDSIRAYWDSAEIAPPTPMARPDLGDTVYWVRHVSRDGFTLELPVRDADGRLDLIGERGGRPAGRLSLRFVAPHLEAAPTPPEALAARVSDLSGSAFLLSGQKAFTDFSDQITRVAGDLRGKRILDWGCGCGRLTRYLPRLGAEEILGCDIDAEAVAWCAANLEGRFTTCTPDPPLPYDDGEVDVALASSIFTHLERDEQQRWLAELRRVIAKDGLLVASVSGEYAGVLGRSARLGTRAAPGSTLQRASAVRRVLGLRRAGIQDGSLDGHLDGIAPPGYYRATHQTRAYTLQAWSRHFEILDYVERGLNGHQDLVIMRPLGTSRGS
jgi:SAM-dependent methyltransferase